MKNIALFPIIAGLILWSMSHTFAQEAPCGVCETSLSGTLSRDSLYDYKDSIVSTAAVADAAHITLQAGQKIRLKPGSRARAGASGEVPRLRVRVSHSLTATDTVTSDAYIRVSWTIASRYFKNLPPNDEGILYVRLLDTESREEIFSEELFLVQVMEKGSIRGQYRHYVGSAQHRRYRLEVLLEGRGTPIITPLEATGSTHAYYPLAVTATHGDYAEQVVLSWVDQSDMISEYRLFRDGTLLATRNAIDTLYRDIFDDGTTGSLVSGQTYNYCIEPYSGRFDRVYDPVCAEGSTYDIGFRAGDEEHNTHVPLSWNDVSAFADRLQVLRDGALLITLPADITSLEDPRPVFGAKHVYGLRLIKDGEPVVTAYDEGSVPPNGHIAGQVLASGEDLGIGGIKVVATIDTGEETIRDSVMTDATGTFTLDSLYYGEQAKVKLTANAAGVTFSPAAHSLKLQRGDARHENLIFRDTRPYDTVGLAWALTDFQADADTVRDVVRLSWDYTPPGEADTVYFHLYRSIAGEADSRERLALLTDSARHTLTHYDDFEGLPGVVYDYKIIAYVWRGTTAYARKTSGLRRVTYPQSPVPDGRFTAVPDPGLGTVSLHWSHPSLNYDGVILYRDGAAIQTIADTATHHFTDYDGRPGSRHRYHIEAFTMKADSLYRSAATFAPDADYPRLPSLAYLGARIGAQPILSWHPPFVPIDYNYDGVRLYRNGVWMADVLKDFESAYRDADARPGALEIYQATVFKYNTDTDDESWQVGTGITYGPLAPPTAFAATDGTHPGYIALSWAYEAEDPDGFLLLRAGDTLATLPAGARQYKEVLAEEATVTHTYRLQAFADRQGERIYSSAVADAGSTLPSGGTEAIHPPEQFTASDHWARHVMLEWSYPEFIFSRFVVYRDGVVLDTLLKDDRVYYDYTAQTHRVYAYQLKALLDGLSSKLVGDQGGLGSDYSLSGTVATREGIYGVPGVNITAHAFLPDGEWIKKTETDASGYYRITELPNLSGTLLTVTAQEQNHTFEADSLTLTVEDTVYRYTADFTETYWNPVNPEDEVATPVDVVATPNTIDQTVEVRWNVNSPNYSGFKVFRGLVEIADVSSYDAKVVIDTEGFPGYDYDYRVVAYWNTTWHRYESEPVADLVFFPSIPSVEAIRTVQLEEEDQVRISWSHPSDKHDYYELYRNDEVIGVVPVGERMEFYDLGGLPGRSYHYGIKAVKTIETEGVTSSFESAMVTTVGTFPLLSQADSLTLTSPANSNFVAFSWHHVSENFDGYLVQRDGQIIDTLAHTHRSFSDAEAAPGQQHTYRFITYVHRDEATYTAAPVQYESVHDSLRQVDRLRATLRPDNGTMLLTWDYAAEHITGFKIYRDGDFMAILPDTVYQWVGDTGIPGATYSYTVVAYDQREGIRYESESREVTIDFPAVPTPQWVTASDARYPNHVEMAWGYTASSRIPVDFFDIYRNGTKIARIDGGQFRYQEVQNDVAVVYTYGIRAVRVIDGIAYTSALVTDDGAIATRSANDFISTMTASKGTYRNRVQITWTTAGDVAADHTLKVYRNEQLLDIATPGQLIYYDDHAIPGQQYVYRVAYENDADSLLSSYADKGYRQANGRLEGQVVTQQQSLGVPGVSIIATAHVDDNYYTYRTETNHEGKFEINNVFYGEEAVYEVVASYPEHVFTDPMHAVAITATRTTGYVPVFFDETAYLIRGMVKRELAGCGLDSVRVTLTTGAGRGNSIEESYTDRAGRYSFIINPLDEDVSRYTLEADTAKVTFNSGIPDTTWLAYTRSQVSIARANDYPLVTTVDFSDTTTYTVRLNVRTSCGPVGNHRFQIHVGATDGCFSRTYQTLDNGSLEITLPPMAYEFTLLGAENASPELLAIVDYLRVRPAPLDLASLHQQWETGQLTREALAEKLNIGFVYHKAPIISVTGFTYSCDVPIITQEAGYSLNLNVYEQHDDELCAVDEGFLLIKNAGAKQPRDTVYYDPELRGFLPYEFIGGDPNLVAPFTLPLIAEYHTAAGGYQGEKIYAVIVEGSKAPPGNDIIVEVDRSGNQVQLPLFVLRDPPGDGSYSYIEKGHTFDKTFVLEKSGQQSDAFEFNFSLGLFGRYVALNSSLKIDDETNGGTSFRITGETAERFQTSRSSVLNGVALTGEEADVIVGAGVAVAYGIVQSVEVDRESCTVRKSSSIQLSPNEINTTWNYTVRHIEQLIEEYEQQLVQIREGTLEIEGVEEDELFVQTLKQNWEEILRYHRHETMPHFSYCQNDLIPVTLKIIEKYHAINKVLKLKEIEDKVKNIGSSLQELLDFSSYDLFSFSKNRKKFREAKKAFKEVNGLIDQYRELEEIYDVFTGHFEFCEQVVSTDEAGREILNPDFEWTNESIDLYNRLVAFKNEGMINFSFGLIDHLKVAFSQVLGDQLSEYMDKRLEETWEHELRHLNEYLAGAENITFDAGSTYAKEASLGTYRSSYFNQDYTLDLKFLTEWGKTEDREFTISAGLGGETGFNLGSLKSVKKDGKDFSEKFQFRVKNAATSGNTSTVGYVLADDDAGDQFSVTVVQGLETNHTPYFDLLGGRSSCPPEQGTISRDEFLQIELMDADDRLVNNTQYGVPADETAIFPLKVSNSSFFGEPRPVEIFVPSGTNEQAAAIILETGGKPGGTLPVDLVADEPFYTYVQIAQGPVAYEYDDIQIAVRPQCEDDLNQSGDAVALEVNFRRPCSTVSLLSDGNRTATRGGTADGEGWIVYKAPEGEREQLFLKLTDYDPESAVLEDITLEYRPEGVNHWTEIGVLTAEELLAFYEAYILTYPHPTYPYVWDITDEPDLVDGAYEIRARTFCRAEGENYSNALTGTIDRTSLQVYGRWQPADGILSLGDEVAVRFNEPIKCTALDKDSVSLVQADGTAVPFTVACHPDLGITLSVADSILAAMEGDTLIAAIAGVQDHHGNVLEEPTAWRFVVHHNPAYWFPAHHEIELYQGSQATINAQLHNTSQADLAFSLAGQEVSWLSTDIASGSIPPSGRPVRISVDAGQLTAGTYRDTITARVNGFSEEDLVITAHVTATPPDWEVAPIYEHNMTAVVHFAIDSVAATDTLDLVSAWVDNTLRGVSDIQKVAHGIYRAYLTVAGSTTDTGSELQFRIWDASVGIEYEGIPDRVYTYENNKSAGTTAWPVELSVSTKSDRARYLPITNQWTWISFNTEKADMSLNSYLSDIIFEDPDLVAEDSVVLKFKTSHAMSEYSRRTGWVSVDGLDTIDTRLGYRLKLVSSEPLKDTKAYLRVTGADAEVKNIALAGGWNMVGYPLQAAADINEALAGLSFSDEDWFKSDRQVAQYAAGDGAWYGMEQLIPNQGYHVYASVPLLLSYNESAALATGGRMADEGDGVLSIVRESGTHRVIPSAYQYNMTFMATVESTNGSSMEGYHVMAMVGEECRGIGRLVYQEKSGRHVVSLFVYARDEGEEIKFVIIDKDGNEYQSRNRLLFEADRDLGTLTNPYVFTADSEVAPDKALAVYPNISTGLISVRYFAPQAISHQIKVSDLSGMLVYEEEVDLQAGWNEFGIDITQAGDGMYHLTVSDGESIYTAKLVKAGYK